MTKAECAKKKFLHYSKKNLSTRNTLIGNETINGKPMNGYEFKYSSKANWITYQSMLDFATIKNDLKDLKPDMIDPQSFM
jgi:hypothetical protein